MVSNHLSGERLLRFIAWNSGLGQGVFLPESKLNFGNVKSAAIAGKGEAKSSFSSAVDVDSGVYMPELSQLNCRIPQALIGTQNPISPRVMFSKVSATG